MANSSKPMPKRYKLLSLLGKGGFGDCYLAYDRLTATEVAIKISRRVEGNPASHEAVMLALVAGHDGVVRLLDYYKTAEHWYLVFEAAKGGELFHRIITDDGLREEDARLAARRLLEILLHLHERNIIHRDIKPENILYRSPDSAADDFVLADFGLSAIVSSHRFGFVPGYSGSVGYCPPEMLLGYGAGRAGDIWSLGIVTFAMLTGRMPFRSLDPEAIYTETISGPIEFSEREWEGLSDEAWDFCKGCLEWEAGRRMTAEEALRHPWFTRSRRESTVSASSSVESHLSLDSLPATSSTCSTLYEEDPKALAYPERPMID